jgi:FkbM family methyltransferase
MLHAKPQAGGVAFEPSRLFRRFLRKNLALAGHANIEISELLLGRTQGRIRLYNNVSTASAVTADYDGHQPLGKQRVVMTTLDLTLRAHRPVDFIKIDTDGFDFEVLRGAQAILAEDRPVLWFELAAYLLTNPYAELTWLQGKGYERLICFSPDGTMLGMTVDARQAIDWSISAHYCNVLSWPYDAPAEARVSDLMTRLAH